MQTKTISTRYLDDSDVMLVKSFLSIIHLSSEHGWKLTGEADGDVVIVDLEQGYDYPSIKEYMSDSHVLAYTSGDCSEHGDMCLHKPIRAKEFFSVISRLERQEQEDALAATKISESAQAAAVNEPADAPSFYSAITNYRQRPATIIQANSLLLMTDPDNDSYYSPRDLGELLPYINGQHGDQLQFVEADEATLGNVRDTCLKRSIDGLVWYVCQQRHSNVLLGGINNETALKLKRWPNFKEIRYTPSDFRIAGFLSANTANINEVMATTQVERLDAVAFINACYTLGYLEVTNKSLLKQGLSEVMNMKARLFGKIRAGLGMH